ncbi:MAG: DNA repair exonuclease [Candidatus Aenigmarchaeota archaeon]|nr:DNA repair exonuclease [Candidatus Aenigmarchaeota archaeon]
MKISIISDLHFGYAWNSRLEEDSFQNANEAIEKSLDSDLILIIGDIFDSRNPNTEILARAFKILSKPLLEKNKGIRLLNLIDKTLEKISERTLKGIPVITIAGTHERRGDYQLNSLEALEQTGFIINLHKNGIVFEKDDQKVAIQGLSGVPERNAYSILEQWNPKPVKGCYNILMIHQSIEPFVYSPLEPPTLNLSNLPKGFDLIIDGHIHTSHYEKLGNTTFIIPGSTVITQLKKEEAENPKGFYKLQLPENKLDFIKLENARKFIYKEIHLDDKKTINESIQNKLDEILNQKFEKKPLIKLKIFGKYSDVIDREIKELQKKYEDKLILKITTELESPEIKQKLKLLENMREKRLSLEEMGMQLLNKNLEELKFRKMFDPENIFKLLADGATERALDIITKKQATLKTQREWWK